MNTDKIIAEKIAGEYAPKPTSKLSALRKLDRKAHRGANAFAYAFGIVGALLLGAGMSVVLGALSIPSQAYYWLAIAAGVAGIAMMAVNYPCYKAILAKSKEKYAGDIMRLAQEIADSDDE